MHVSLRHMPLKKTCPSRVGGAPGITRMRGAFPRAISKYTHFGRYPSPSNPRPGSEKGYKRVPGRCSGKARKRGPGRTLSRAGQCSRRGRAGGGLHSDAIMHTQRCLTMLQPGPLQTGSHRYIRHQRGHPLQWEGACACGHTTVGQIRTPGAWECPHFPLSQ